MVLEIPHQLKDQKFVRVCFKQKIAIEKGWQNNPYSFEEIQKYFPGENYGVLCGPGLRVLDDDSKDKKLLRLFLKTFGETFRVRDHAYFKFDNEEKKKIIFFENGEHLGELQGEGQYVVGPESIHPSGEKYDVRTNLPVKTISYEKFKKVFSKFIKSNEDFSASIDSLGLDDLKIIETFKEKWKEGDRQNLTLSLAGYLRKEKGFGFTHTANIIKSICAAADDKDVNERLAAVQQTYFKDEGEIKGVSGLTERDIKIENIEEKPTKPLKLLTFTDFESIKEDKSWIVKDFLRPKTLNMVYSPPKNLKSIATLSLAMCISQGREWLGLETKKCNVLYMDKENSDIVIRERLVNFYKGFSFNRKNFPLFFLRDGLFMNSKRKFEQSFIAELERVIIEKEIKVLFIDTLHRFAHYDENSADDINLLYEGVLRPLIEDYGLCVVFLHHTTKPSNGRKAKYRGSGDFEAIIDNSYSIQKRKDNSFVIINEAGRRGEREDIYGEVSFDDNEFSFHTTSKSIDEVKKNSAILKDVTNKVREIFNRDEGSRRLQLKDIKSILDLENYDYSEATLKRCLKWLYEDENFLEKDGLKYVRADNLEAKI